MTSLAWQCYCAWRQEREKEGERERLSECWASWQRKGNRVAPRENSRVSIYNKPHFCLSAATANACGDMIERIGAQTVHDAHLRRANDYIYNLHYGEGMHPAEYLNVCGQSWL